MGACPLVQAPVVPSSAFTTSLCSTGARLSSRAGSCCTAFCFHYITVQRWCASVFSSRTLLYRLLLSLHHCTALVRVCLLEPAPVVPPSAFTTSLCSAGARLSSRAGSCCTAFCFHYITVQRWCASVLWSRHLLCCLLLSLHHCAALVRACPLEPAPVVPSSAFTTSLCSAGAHLSFGAGTCCTAFYFQYIIMQRWCTPALWSWLLLCCLLLSLHPCAALVLTCPPEQAPVYIPVQHWCTCVLWSRLLLCRLLLSLHHCASLVHVCPLEPAPVVPSSAFTTSLYSADGCLSFSAGPCSTVFCFHYITVQRWCASVLSSRLLLYRLLLSLNHCAALVRICPLEPAPVVPSSAFITYLCSTGARVSSGACTCCTAFCFHCITVQCWCASVFSSRLLLCRLLLSLNHCAALVRVCPLEPAPVLPSSAFITSLCSAGARLSSRASSCCAVFCFHYITVQCWCTSVLWSRLQLYRILLSLHHCAALVRVCPLEPSPVLPSSAFITSLCSARARLSSRAGSCCAVFCFHYITVQHWCASVLWRRLLLYRLLLSLHHCAALVRVCPLEPAPVPSSAFTTSLCSAGARLSSRAGSCCTAFCFHYITVQRWCASVLSSWLLLYRLLLSLHHCAALVHVCPLEPAPVVPSSAFITSLCSTGSHVSSGAGSCAVFCIHYITVQRWCASVLSSRLLLYRLLLSLHHCAALVHVCPLEPAPVVPSSAFTTSLCSAGARLSSGAGSFAIFCFHYITVQRWCTSVLWSRLLCHLLLSLHHCAALVHSCPPEPGPVVPSSTFTTSLCSIGAHVSYGAGSYAIFCIHYITVQRWGTRVL
ncbi:hypothetical protein NDU88_007369 [Pleurodeles waltl]|uniref:Uncharacterized protein n=1 Tax=Pleurodeles waltl TaxID=8319 RepID=A0AAV7MIY5_PLEWA|nr:hypothetical protein NDU88_007369 [Pleurodeles waltl]